MSEPEKATLYWPNGVAFWRSKAIYAQGLMLDGRRHGNWVFWYRDGRKQVQGEYFRDSKTGTWVQWRQDGGKATQGNFAEGKMHGKWVDWHVNGTKALESHWHMGKRDGKWIYWKPDGSIEKTLEYDYRVEKEQNYSIYTDLETKHILRVIQKRRMDEIWQRLVGRTVASLVTPWHAAVWIVIFIPAFGLIRARTQWGGLALAGLLAFVITSVLSWFLGRNRTLL